MIRFLVTLAFVSLCTPAIGQLALIEVAADLNRPVYVTHAGDGSGRLFVVESTGAIRILHADGTLGAEPFLDVSGLLEIVNGEQGLLGLAFHPDYGVVGSAGAGLFYINYTGVGGGTRIASYRVSDSDPDLADPASGDVLMYYDQPFPVHNGGWIGFGPDGYLYIAAGDGGGAGDPFNNASRLDEMLGKIHRIDVGGDDFPGDPDQDYAVPDDNPFVGVPGANGSIWQYGLRNPWRASFDRENGDLWIADVGFNNWEEVNHNVGNVGGQFYGWRCREGLHAYGKCGVDGWVDPQHSYGHGINGCSVTGGYVYRGCELGDAYRGRYFFGDFCSGNIWTLSPDDGYTAALEQGGSLRIASFGEDEDGELYVIDFDFGSDGKVFRVVNPSASGMGSGCDPDECVADLNGDGELNFFDVSAFLNAYFGMDPVVDFDQDGDFDFFDVSLFLGAYSAGCP